MHLVHRALSGLHERDAVLGVADRLVGAPDLGPQLSDLVSPAASSAARLMRKPLESFSSDLLSCPSVVVRFRYAFIAAMFWLIRRPMVSSLKWVGSAESFGTHPARSLSLPDGCSDRRALGGVEAAAELFRRGQLTRVTLEVRSGASAETRVAKSDAAEMAA